VSRDALFNIPLIRRFDWYSVDANLFFDRCDKLGKRAISSLHIPVRNRLNTAMASLLWGSLWVFNRERALMYPGFIGIPEGRFLIDNFIQNLDPMRFTISEYEAAKERLDTIIKEIPSHTRVDLNHLFGSALGMMNLRYLQAKSREPTKQFQAYAKESGREEINMYLFNRWFRRYITSFSRRQRLSNDNIALRFFPLPSDKNKIPRHVLLAHYHTIRSQKYLNVTATLDPTSYFGAVNDRVLIDNIGSVRASHVDQLTTWSVDILKNSGNLEEDANFFQERRKEIKHQGGRDALHRSIFANLTDMDLELENRPPLDLLVPQDSLVIEHPQELWYVNDHAPSMKRE
jgi:hypothetical protein